MSAEYQTGGLDHYDLERLAEALAVREAKGGEASNSPATSSGRSSGEAHELPLLAPLNHAHPLLSGSKPFDVDAFLLSRPNTLLTDLRTELRGYLGELKEELVQLINDDYAAFISLSTDLKGEGARLERLHWPLGSVKAEILKSRQDLAEVQEKVKEKLAERANIREEKALLNLLLKLSDSVTRLESLLLITSPQDGANGNSVSSVDISAIGMRDVNGNNIGLQLTVPDEEVKDDRLRGGQAKHLWRVATEHAQLLYHADKARSENCVFADEMQWRIDRIKTTLSRDLDHLFSNVLSAVISSSNGDIPAATTDKARWISELGECFRTYDLLRGWRDAEEVVRRDVIRPFVKKTIFSGSLNAAHSPLLPRTPLPQSRSTLMSPRTPFTPFATSKTNYFDSLQTSEPMLDDSDGNELAILLNSVLRFVQVNCEVILQLAEKAESRRKNSDTLLLTQFTDNAPETVRPKDDGFEIMANVIWDEIARSIMEELGSTIFAAGQPDDFHANYLTTQNFITSLEQLAPSLESVVAMRNHPTYSAFQRRWQLPVYFQLRWKEIVGKLEDALSGVESPPLHGGYATPQAAAVIYAIESCWSSDTFIPDLAYRFWRLSLQILSRYRTWLDASLPVRQAPLKAITNTNPEKMSASSPLGVPASRIGTPSSTTETAESTVGDDLALKRLGNALQDLNLVEKRVLTMWEEEIGIVMPYEQEDEDARPPKDVLSSSLSSLTSLETGIIAQIKFILIKRCTDTLSLVRSIPSQYRAMSKKKEPTEVSYFIPNVLQPLRQLFQSEGSGGNLKERYGKEWSLEVFDAVCEKYASYLEAMKKTEDSLRRYKKGKISAFSLFGGGSTKDNEEGKDEERVRAQMVLDVQALGKEGSSLGVNLETNQAYTALLALATQPPE